MAESGWVRYGVCLGLHPGPERSRAFLCTETGVGGSELVLRLSPAHPLAQITQRTERRWAGWSPAAESQKRQNTDK